MQAAIMDGDSDGGHEQLISREVVARRLDCSPATIRRMEDQGRFIPHILVGNLIRWRERDVNAWIAARAATTRKIEAAAAKSVEPRTRNRRE